MKLLAADVTVIQPGDGMAVCDLKKGIIQSDISWLTGGPANHTICCLGGYEIIESTALGVMRTDLRNYLNGQFRLVIKRLDPAPDLIHRTLICDYWRSISFKAESYNFAGIVGFIPLAIARKLNWRWGRRHIHNLIGKPGAVFCSELAVDGWRQFAPNLFNGDNADEVAPEDILECKDGLSLVADWNAPVLEA